MAKNDTNEIELNAYGEKIAPKPSKKQNDASKNTVPKKSASKKTEGFFSKKSQPASAASAAPTAPVAPAASEKKTRQSQKSPTRSSQPKDSKTRPASAAAERKQRNTSVSAQEIHPATGLPLHTTNHKPVKRTPLKIIPLGGLNEIGKNMTVFECSNDMFIVDCGLAFPDSDMPGVDLVLPDFSYVEQNAGKIRGIVITHGHEDHIGGLAYLLKKVNVPVYATRLTIGLIEGKLREHGILSSAQLNVVTPRQTVKMGCMAVEFIRVKLRNFVSIKHYI